VRTELAYAYMTQRYVVQARREIEAAFAMGADDSVAHYVAGVVYAWTDQGEKAERHLRRAVALDPHNVVARDALERLFGQ
jgi:Tfp pilus assembly protein PilF